MENEKVLVKGTPKKNTAALILIFVGVVIMIVSFIVAGGKYQNAEFYYNAGFGYGLWYPYHLEYSFSEFFFGQFFNFSLLFGYLFLLGIVVLVIGIIIKVITEKCEITVTNEGVYGKLANGKAITIPLNQISGLRKASFNGVSISSIGTVNDFHCFENPDEIIKALSYLLAAPQQTPTAELGNTPAIHDNNDAVEQLKKFKELSDSGIITQEEFDAKKKQLLGL